MLHIFICEDDPAQRVRTETLVAEYISKHPKEHITLAFSSANPLEMLDYITSFANKAKLFFLDVDLQSEMSGIELGASIRKADPSAQIVFITTHDELAYLTFQHKIGAMDYIIKGEAQNNIRVTRCIHEAYTYFQQADAQEEKTFTVNTNGTLWHVPHDDILFFETSLTVGKRMILHTEDSELDFRGIISELSNDVPEFFRCHRSFIVNPKKVVRIDKSAREAHMTNGAIVPVAVRKMTELIQIVAQKK